MLLVDDDVFSGELLKMELEFLYEEAELDVDTIDYCQDGDQAVKIVRDALGNMTSTKDLYSLIIMEL